MLLQRRESLSLLHRAPGVHLCRIRRIRGACGEQGVRERAIGKEKRSAQEVAGVDHGVAVETKLDPCDARSAHVDRDGARRRQHRCYDAAEDARANSQD